MPKKELLIIIAISYSILLIILSIAKIDAPDLGVNNRDKLLHFLAYGLLTLLWYLPLFKIKKRSALLISATGAIIYGIILEVLQGMLTTFRDSNTMDAVANAFGVIVMVVIIIILKRKIGVKKI